MRTLSKLPAALVLACCIMPGRLAAQSAPQAGTTYRNQLQESDDDNRCVTYGAQPGTEPYADCRAKLRQMHELAREAAENQSNAQAEDRKAAMLQQFLANQARQQQDFYDQQMANIRAAGQSFHPYASRTLNCTTNYSGNYAYTNCQ
jgi:hypothetical protein